MKYDTILFDLDGTLLNTIDDLRICMNHALKQNGFDADYKNDDIKKFIGSGAEVFVRRALKKFEPVSKEQFEQVFEDYNRYYHEHRNDFTQPFEGVIPTLLLLKKRGIRIGVISNKPDTDTKGCVDNYFHNIFDFVIGSRPNIPTKPNPLIFYLISTEYQLSPKKTLYVGDMDVDIEFAKNVEMDVAICLFGFGDKNKLNGQTYTIDKFEDILSLGE